MAEWLLYIKSCQHLLLVLFWVHIYTRYLESLICRGPSTPAYSTQLRGWFDKKKYPEFLGAIKKGKVRGRKNKGGTKEDQLEPDHGKNNEETKRKGPLLWVSWVHKKGRINREEIGQFDKGVIRGRVCSPGRFNGPPFCCLCRQFWARWRGSYQ